MFRFTLRMNVVILAITISMGQNKNFENECDILMRLDKLENELNAAKNTILLLTNKMKENESGSIYIRWGRTTCSGNGTELVYSGLTGGSYYRHTGAANNYICLPTTPIYSEFYDAAANNGGRVYGAAYQTGERNSRLFFPHLDDGINLDQNNAPCAVCRTIRSTVLMVPAQNKCMDGWTLEYKGFLVSGSYTHEAATEYICLDDQPEIIAKGGADENGKLLYFAEGRCGALPCPPYINNREFTCSVCGK